MIWKPIFPFVLALNLIVLHGPDGAEIDINLNEVSSIRDRSVASEGHFAKGVNCLLFMTNGKVIGVREDCDQVRMMVQNGKPLVDPKGPGR
jgi:hypothetical protein